MGIEGSRVGIVGGSIAGCAAAIALRRSGCDVSIYERNPRDLQDRGFGIAIPLSLYEDLVNEGYVDDRLAIRRRTERTWVVRDAGSPVGRMIWRQPFVAVLNNWGVLWRALRDRLPDEVYRRQTPVTGIEATADGVEVTFDDGTRDRWDVAVGADGRRSIVRGCVDAESAAYYAGYCLFRGNYPESRLANHLLAELEHGFVTVCFPGGHGIFYLIQDSERRSRRVNWAVYGAVPEPVKFDDHMSLPPGRLGDNYVTLLNRLLDIHFPSYWAEIVRGTTSEELYIQPIYDTSISTYVTDRAMLIGDAATVVRPHSGSGATKALQDALTLERACRTYETWEQILATYNAERCAAGNALVELGQRIGRAQVEQTPPWDAMTTENLRTWWDSAAGGRQLPYVSGQTRGF